MKLLLVTPETPESHINQIKTLIWSEWGCQYHSFEELEEEVKHCASGRSVSRIFYAYFPEEERVLGTISLLKSDIDSYPEISPWLANFIVSPEFRGQGVGRALYEEVIRAAFGKLGLEGIYLYTENPQPYESKGWQKIEGFRYQEKEQFLLKLSGDFVLDPR